MQSHLWSPIQGDVQKWKLNSDSVTESNISAPRYSSHGQNKSSNRCNFKTTAHPSFTLLMALPGTWPKMADNDVINKMQVHLRVTLLPVNCCTIFSLIRVKILQDLIWPKKLFLPIWFRAANPQLPFSVLCPPLRVWASSALDKLFECLVEYYHWHILNSARRHGDLTRFAREADRGATIQTIKSIFYLPWSSKLSLYQKSESSFRKQNRMILFLTLKAKGSFWRWALMETLEILWGPHTSLSEAFPGPEINHRFLESQPRQTYITKSSRRKILVPFLLWWDEWAKALCKSNVTRQLPGL